MNEVSCTHIDLLRHGETIGGKRFRGSLDEPLSPHGWRQMHVAVEGAGPWDTIVSSPLSRCADFARAFAHCHAIPLESDDRLREMHFGAWEGRTATELMATEPDALTGFWNDPITHPPPGAEPLEQFQARTLAAWRDVANRYPSQRVLLITHGGVIRVILCQVLGRPLAHSLRFEVPHASRHGVRLGKHGLGGLAELLTAAVPSYSRAHFSSRCSS